jgi:hypothetical protein
MYFQDDALELGDLLTGLDAFWHAIVTGGSTSSQGLVTGTTITLEPDVPIIDSATGGIVGFETISETHQYVGNGTAEPLPPATQLLIEWQTGQVVGGRRLRGRTFIGCLTEDHSTNGVPASGFAGIVSGAATTLSAESMQVYSATHHETHGISSVNVWSQFAVLRSRRD